MGHRINIVLLKKIASALKELRELNNLTQGDVYYDTGIHIGRIEAYRVNLTISTLNELCIYFEISLADFFERLEDK
jgi:transcriptional regulator with XRE-family HTH domain